jgi:hypothetical protein
MPDRSAPGSAWFVLAEVLAALVGVAGLLLEPSASVVRALAQVGLEWAVLVWSLTFLVAGLAAALARWRRRYLAETAAVDVLAGTFALWALLVAVSGNGSAVQAGLGFAVAGAFMHGWARYRRRRLRRTLDGFRRVVASVAAGAAQQEARG